MIYTTYFSKLKDLPSNIIPIAICGKSPDWYRGLEYKKLAPKYSFFKVWKETHDNEFYIKCFEEQVLNNLNVLDVVTDLYSMISDPSIQQYLYMVNCPPWANDRYHIALVCYEKPDNFCHRHLVAEWFNKHHIQCEEYKW